MEFERLIQERRSIRAFGPRPVKPETIDAVLRAAGSAPSAGNLQAYEVVCVREAGRRLALAEAAFGERSVSAAPVVLVFFAHPKRSERRYGARGAGLYCVQDATIACAFAHLAAADLGLGSVWIGVFDDAAVCAAVSAPAGLKPVAMLPVGHPAESPAPRKRRHLGDLVRREAF
ncbi:MAG: nitroreductase family protein [Elusimicrobia bacterium]|nr:nitroreductase family protein [Elusimicrobiota bacterium]